MFADAYIESGRHFTDKRSIFSQAVERLAKEANATVAKTGHTLTIAQKVDLSSEVFAKLLLSGADGIGTSEATADRIYPLLASLFEKTIAAEGILATRLFKPGYSADQHRPVHKIVAEYCAADYLAKRIADPTDQLTIHKCLPIIAPNATVRDELRGLLGWMAALGNKSIQEAAIELDPYAVLANGDPSQLEPSSKRLLIGRLKGVEAKDPYFRRGDSWRRFSAAGFFSQDVINEIKPLLARESDGHLRDLILELLAGSPANAHLTTELRQLVLNMDETEPTRLLASRCLLDLESHDHRADLAVLVSEASHTSLKIAVEIIKYLGQKTFASAYLADFFRTCSTLYPAQHKPFERPIGARYFLKRFVEDLEPDSLQWLLDDLSSDLSCKCGKEYYACDCRVSISKIIGLILDRYFEVSTAPFDAVRIWKWLENLNFHDQPANYGKAVEVLKNDEKLRNEILTHAFGKLTDSEEIFRTRIEKFEIHSHSGLQLQSRDQKFLVDLAFESDNPTLWVSFIAAHHRYQSKTEKGSNPLRRSMREQALEKAPFMREWIKSNRVYADLVQRNKMPRYRRTRRIKRRQLQQSNIRLANLQFLRDNRELIESGRHWKCLIHFSELVLMDPEEIEPSVGDEELVRNALRNCVDFIDSSIPGLSKLAELKCAGETLHAEMVLFAACLEIMRADGSLKSIDSRLLTALRTNVDMSYSGVSPKEREAIKEEIDRLIFSSKADSENFLREYVEPQLNQTNFAHPDVWLLRGDDAFSDLRASISTEWLRSFPELQMGPLDTLFEIAAEFSDRDELQKIILERCDKFMSDWPNPTGDESLEQKRIFWFVRAFYFLDNTPTVYWDWLQSDKNSVFPLSDRSGRFSYGGHSYWPKLTASKIEAVLNAFIDKWPKVDLPGHWGTESPRGERAYRFLTDLVGSIDSDESKDAVLIIDRLLADSRFADMYNDLKSIRASKIRKNALRDFAPPLPEEIVNRLDRNMVVNVEGLRQLVIQELQDFQKAIDGGEFNSADRFYDGDKRLGEVRATEIIAERLNLRLEPQGIAITPEHQLKSANRSDFTATKFIGGKRRLLVTEVKGQWHKELYTAAVAQLYDRYSIHPDAEQQGIYLVIWFGPGEQVAGLKNKTINTAQELKTSIEQTLPPELVGLIDVFVLDVSKA